RGDDVRIDHVPLIEERRHARGRAEVVRLRDPAERPLRRGLLGDAVQIWTWLAQLAEAPVVDLMARIAAVDLDSELGFGDVVALVDAELSGVTLDTSRFVILPRKHRRLVEGILLPRPMAQFVIPRPRHEAQRRFGPAALHLRVRRDVTGP